MCRICEAAAPPATRQQQLNQKESKGRGRGRGRGRGNGKNNKDEDDEYENKWEVPDDGWVWYDGYGWYYEGDQVPKSKKPKSKDDKPDKPDKTEKPNKPDKPAKSKGTKRKTSTPTGKSSTDKKTQDENKKTTKAKKDQEPVVKKARKAASKTDTANAAAEPMPAVTTQKDQKKEILEFLHKCKDLTDENARDTIKSMIPNFKKHAYECSLNIYWVRGKQLGVGVGVTSKTQKSDVAFFGYRSECDTSWIYAIAAAIKAAELHVT